MEHILLGCAEVDITPAYPVRTIGFSREDEWSRSVESPLLAQAAVWESKEEKCCLLTIDHIGFLPAEADRLRERVAGVIQIKKEKVMICFSHTHAAPDEMLDRKYLKFVSDQAEICVKKALREMRPVMAAWGNATVDIGVNRRKGGISLDRRAGILLVTEQKEELGTDENKDVRLLILRLTAHANVLKQDNYNISPDYFGAVRRKLEKEYHCQVMLTQGASGNVAPKYFQSKLTPPDAEGEEFVRSDNALEEMAEEICAQAGQVIAHMAPHPIRQMMMYSRQVHLYSEIPEYM